MWGRRQSCPGNNKDGRINSITQHSTGNFFSQKMLQLNISKCHSELLKSDHQTFKEMFVCCTPPPLNDESYYPPLPPCSQFWQGRWPKSDMDRPRRCSIFRAMRCQRFIFQQWCDYFWKSLTSPSSRSFSLTIRNNYFSIILLILGPIILGLFTDWLGSSERKLY